MRLFALAFALWIMSVAATTTAERGNLDRACQLLKEEVRDCACTVQFLQHHLGPQLGLLLLKVWIAGESRAGDGSRAFATIYRENDETSVLDAELRLFESSSAISSRVPTCGFYVRRGTRPRDVGCMVKLLTHR